MSRPPRKRQLEKQPLRIHSHALSQEESEVLTALSSDASDLLGWSVSHSAVVRALLRYVKQQPPGWAMEHLHPLLEEELAQGRVWGHRSK